MLGRYRNRNPWTAAALLLLALAPACMSSGPDDTGAPVEGHAFLSIVGTTSVTVGGTARDTISVRYHDDLDAPLRGDVSFYLIGDPRGADLSAITATTDDDGVAHIDVLPGAQTSFQVTATATYAKPVSWNVTIGPGGSVLDATGVFQVASQFDLADAVPVSVAKVITQLREMTDGPNDPGSWVIDHIIEQMSDINFTAAVTTLRPNLDELVNYQLLRNTPGLVDLLGRLAGNLDGVTHEFGASSTLTVTRGADGGFVASHDVGAFRCVVEGEQHEYSLAKLSTGNSHADAIALTVRGKTQVSLGHHQLSFVYGHFLRYVLVHLIVPALLPGETQVGGLLIGLVNCNRAAQVIASRIGGINLTYESACQSALAVFGNSIEAQLEAVTAQATLEIGGSATPQDVDGDGHIDSLVSGEWRGAMTISTGPNTLAPGQIFTAVRQ